jgi:hypothetical protein
VDQGSRFSLNAAAARLRGSGAALFIVGYGLEETWPLELKDAAEASGGGWFSVTVPDDVIPLLTLVAERLRGQYILSYTNPEPRSGSGDRRLNLAVMGVRAEAAFRVADDSTPPTGLVAPLIFLLLAVLSLIGALLWSGKVGGRKKESARESEE